jgi:hypothetical protein
MRRLEIRLLLATFVPAVLPAQSEIARELPAGVVRSAWAYFDSPLWDISNEGLPFRFTLALPSQRDYISRALFASEARWTLSAGYARVYNSYDGATGIFKNPGGHAMLLSGGRQMFWQLPAFAGRHTPRIALEYGVHVASRPFPADGTHANLKLITGLEWAWPTQTDRVWSAGIYWPHFSNANLLSRNAGYDGLMFRLGRSMQF